MAAQDFKNAGVAGLQIIVHPDHLEELISQYEKFGFFDELMTLLDQGLGQERAHVGMYTELSILYSKYKPEKLMDFIKLNTAKMNIPKVIRACERYCHYEEAVHLYMQYDEFDSAANCMITHSTVAFSHDQFIFVIQKVANSELLYRAITFYIEEQPMQLERYLHIIVLFIVLVVFEWVRKVYLKPFKIYFHSLLNAIEGKVDHARVVSQVKELGHMGLIQPYLKHVQTCNLQVVNEALNELLIEAEDYTGLRESIDKYESFDQISLAGRLEKHELLEMRRIAALVYKKNKKYRQSIELSKVDKIFKDTMETARDSGSSELVLELLNFFIAQKDKECFTAMLYTSYGLLKPDVVLELAWRNGMMDAAMPFMIQSIKQYTTRVDGLDKKVENGEKEKERQKSATNDFVADYNPGMGAGMGPAGFGNLAIGNAPFQPQMGMQMGMGRM